eukprot:364700-Chlamydomonas_euryale.AAC.6
MAPLIDLMNHREGAAKPRGFEPGAPLPWSAPGCVGSTASESGSSRDAASRSDSSCGSSNDASSGDSRSELAGSSCGTGSSSGGSGGGGAVDVPGGVMMGVTSSLHGSPLPLSAGDELCISYVSTSGANAALNAFLNFGFVPEEVLRCDSHTA